MTEDLLPLADYFGNTDGHSREKMQVPVEIEQGRKLHVSVLAAAHVAYELEVERFIPLDGGEVMLCRIRNVLQNEALTDPSVSVEARVRGIAPVSTTTQTYFSWQGRDLGGWGEAQNRLNKS